MYKKFDELFIDETKYGTKIKTDKYLSEGKYPIVDQGQKKISGYTDIEEGIFKEVPAIIFGDHTRLIKYIDVPFFIGADGVKIIRSRLKKVNYKYLYYSLLNVHIPNTGYNRHFKWLKETKIFYPDSEKQKHIVEVLDKISLIIEKKNKQIEQCNFLLKSLFIEMFGDLFTNPMNWNKQPLGAICNKVIRYPTFYGMEYLETGIKVIRIGNILADGRMDLDDKKYVFVDDIVNKDFPETIIEMNDIIMAVRGDGSAAKRIGIIREPQLVGANISPNLIRIKVDCNKLNPIYMFYYLTGEVGQKYLDVYVNKTAKKNIAAKDIVKVLIYVPPLDLQNRFAEYVSSIDKSKLAVKKSLEELEILKKSLMQKYFA